MGIFLLQKMKAMLRLKQDATLPHLEMKKDEEVAIAEERLVLKLEQVKKCILP